MSGSFLFRFVTTCFRRLKHRLFLYVLGALLLVVLTPRRESSRHDSSVQHILRRAPVSLQKDDIPIIIRWENLGGSQDYNITCKSLRCHVTHNRSVRHDHDVLAILFYAMHFGHSELPLPRKPGHLWSLLHDESPRFNDWLFSAKDAMTLFNLTGTFKRESHYPFPTMWLTNPAELTSTEFLVPLQKKNQLRKAGLAPVVFVHTDCNTPSDRSHYMRLLQQYIEIDSYGKCEHNKDFPVMNLSFGPVERRAMNFVDFHRLLAKYKFAFAFENAVCDDYVTEKFWRPFHLGVVPLVFGSPKIKDFAPADRSMIDIRDFRSVKEVANYIAFLDTHDEEYSRYMDFKRTGITNPKLRMHLDKRDWGPGKALKSADAGFECFICDKLHIFKTQKNSGGTLRQWQGKHDHYGCPKPKLFDEKGRYVDDGGNFLKIYAYADYYFKSLRHHIDNNLNAGYVPIHEFAKNIRKKDNAS